VWFYANNGNGEILPAKGRAFFSKNVDELVEVILDNGESVRCTPDHRFMLRDGTFREANQLMPGDSLMPFYWRYKTIKYKRGKSDYEQVWNKGHWQLTHKLVSKALEFQACHGEVIHHYDLNSLNNDPTNLERLTISEHNRRHALIAQRLRDPAIIAKRVETWKKRYSNNAEWKEKASARGVKAWRAMTTDQKARLIQCQKAPESRQKISVALKRTWSDPGYKTKNGMRLQKYAKSDQARNKSSVTAQKTNRNRKNWQPERIRTHVRTVKAALAIRMKREDERAIKTINPYLPYLLGYQHPARLAGGAPKTWRRRLGQIDFKKNVNRLQGRSIREIQQLTGLSRSQVAQYLRIHGKWLWLQLDNHAVASVRRIQAISTPVFDVEVPGLSNFGLSAGIFVHNSKDTTDALAGSYFNAITSEEKSTLVHDYEPAVHAGTGVEIVAAPVVPVEIKLPPGYDRVKVFDA
jgi:DNA gyrase subunit B